MTREDQPCCEYCDTPFDEDDECPACAAYHEQQKAYWFAQFRAEGPRPTRVEIEDCYSSPPEHTKRDILIERLGL